MYCHFKKLQLRVSNNQTKVFVTKNAKKKQTKKQTKKSQKNKKNLKKIKKKQTKKQNIFNNAKQ